MTNKEYDKKQKLIKEIADLLQNVYYDSETSRLVFAERIIDLIERRNK